jgi:hypothetical protein
VSVYDKPFASDPFLTPNPAGQSVTPPAEALSAAMERFRSCRWRKSAEDGMPECCGHRDVRPLTGANGFDAEAWCPGCAFYKLRRTPKKRDYFADRY